MGDRAIRWPSGVLLTVAGAMLLGGFSHAPLVVALGLATTFWPLRLAWRGARGTALRAAVLWAAAAAALGILAEAAAWTEPLAAGRPAAGHLTYLATLASLAALISVLNARSPGGGAWAILMGLLVLVFLIPWAEDPLLLRHAGGLGHLRLDAPWSFFYGLLVLAGVTNFLPTRYGPAALCLGIAFGLEYLGLSRTDWTRPLRGLVWSIVPWLLGVAVWVAAARAGKRPGARSGLEAIWLWFRDHWGVVWALRIQERFNRTAETAQWPLRLSWFGVVSVSGSDDTPEAAEATLKSLLRRFAEPQRFEEAARSGRT